MVTLKIGDHFLTILWKKIIIKSYSSHDSMITINRNMKMKLNTQCKGYMTLFTITYKEHVTGMGCLRKSTSDIDKMMMNVTYTSND